MERDVDSTPKHNRAVRRIEAVLDGVEAADPRYVMGVATLGAEWSFRNLTRREIQPRVIAERGFAVIVLARADLEVEDVLSHVARIGMLPRAMNGFNVDGFDSVNDKTVHPPLNANKPHNEGGSAKLRATTAGIGTKAEPKMFEEGVIPALPHVNATAPTVLSAQLHPALPMPPPKPARSSLLLLGKPAAPKFHVKKCPVGVPKIWSPVVRSFSSIALNDTGTQEKQDKASRMRNQTSMSLTDDEDGSVARGAASKAPANSPADETAETQWAQRIAARSRKPIVIPPVFQQNDQHANRTELHFEPQLRRNSSAGEVQQKTLLTTGNVQMHQQQQQQLISNDEADATERAAEKSQHDATPMQPWTKLPKHAPPPKPTASPQQLHWEEGSAEANGTAGRDGSLPSYFGDDDDDNDDNDGCRENGVDYNGEVKSGPGFEREMSAFDDDGTLALATPAVVIPADDTDASFTDSIYEDELLHSSLGSRSRHSTANTAHTGDEEGAEEASSSGVVVELPSSGNRDDEDDDQGANGEDQVPVSIGGEDQTTTTTTTTSSSGNDGDEMPADAELSAILSRRCDINDALEDGRDLRVKNKVFNVYTEFPEFNMKEIKSFTQTFRKWDVDNDGYLNLTELKRMMECLGAPQTHVGLKEMIKDGGNEEKEGAISFREFMHVLRRARAGEFDNDSGLNNLAKLTEIDVDEVGVGGAKHFFEAKIKEQTVASKFEAEIKADKEERLKQTEEQKKRRAAFRDKAQFFEKGVAPASTAS